MVNSLGTRNSIHTIPCVKRKVYFEACVESDWKGGGGVDTSGAIELDKPPSKPFFVLSRNTPLQTRTEDLDKYYEDILLFHHNCVNYLLL